MLLLLFQLGPEQCALDVTRIVEVLALVELRPLPEAPPAVAGVLTYRGAQVPVVDLSQCALGRPSQRRLSTRIILTRHTVAPGDERLFGVIAEHATETMRQDDRPDYLQWDAGFHNQSWLDAGASTARGLIQIVDVGSLLPTEVVEVLAHHAPPPIL